MKIKLKLNENEPNTIEHCKTAERERCDKQNILVRRSIVDDSPLKHKIKAFSLHFSPSVRSTKTELIMTKRSF